METLPTDGARGRENRRAEKLLAIVGPNPPRTDVSDTEMLDWLAGAPTRQVLAMLMDGGYWMWLAQDRSDNDTAMCSGGSARDALRCAVLTTRKKSPHNTKGQP